MILSTEAKEITSSRVSLDPIHRQLDEGTILSHGRTSTLYDY